jgi:hypothetical protein
MHILNSIIIKANAVMRPIIRLKQFFSVLINAISKLIEKFRRLFIYLVKKQEIFSDKITLKDNELIGIYTKTIVKKMTEKIEKRRRKKKKKGKTTLF